MSEPLWAAAAWGVGYGLEVRDGDCNIKEAELTLKRCLTHLLEGTASAEELAVVAQFAEALGDP